MVYEWKDGTRKSRLNAQKVGERLSTIHSKHGIVTAALVVNDAQKKNSPLHNGFEWDDQEAAEAYRLHQARNIINAIVVSHPTSEGDERMIRAFVHLGADYEDIELVLNIAEKRDALLAQAFVELETARRKYEHLDELTAVFAALHKAREAA